jgi:hypothetical protein
MEKVEWAWVVMGKPEQMSQWRSHWKAFYSKLHIINNQPGDTYGQAGSNRYFEFSGYLEAIDLFQTEGPFILCNDTWFKTHNMSLWTLLLQRFLRNSPKADDIFGDLRTELSNFIEKPSPYLSSWIFFIPNREILEQFRNCLQNAIREAVVADFSKEYLDYVEDWIRPKNPFYGWHIQSNQIESIERKRRCIYIEHRWNAWLLKEGFELCSFGSTQKYLYGLVRIIDRLQTRLFAWGLHPFA